MIIAWAYMVELESGLTKKQTQTLLGEIPDDVEEFAFFSTDSILKEGSVNLLEANSIAYGFVDNDHYDDLNEIIEMLAKVCNDWDNESEDGLYTLKSGLQVKMYCDSETVR